MLAHELKKLPSDGRDLVSGYQYYMNPQARALVKEVFGLSVPVVATCLDGGQEFRTAETIVRDKEGKILYINHAERPAREPVFKCWLSLYNQPRFTLNCEKVAEMRKNAEPGHLVKEQDEIATLLGRKSEKPKTKKAPKQEKPIDIDWLLSLGS